jgi:hypothetical protein
MDVRVKSSFGTALKLFDRRHLGASAAMALAALLAIWLAPSPRPFVEGLASRDMWAELNRRLLPEESWFGLVGPGGLLAGTPGDAPSASGNGITTGALPSDRSQVPDTTAR